MKSLRFSCPPAAINLLDLSVYGRFHTLDSVVDLDILGPPGSRSEISCHQSPGSDTVGIVPDLTLEQEFGQIGMKMGESGSQGIVEPFRVVGGPWPIIFILVPHCNPTRSKPPLEIRSKTIQGHIRLLITSVGNHPKDIDCHIWDKLDWDEAKGDQVPKPSSDVVVGSVNDHKPQFVHHPALRISLEFPPWHRCMRVEVFFPISGCSLWRLYRFVVL